jgi:hypothetical protein
MTGFGYRAAAFGLCLVPFLALPGRAELLGVLTKSSSQSGVGNDKYQLVLDDNGDTSFTFQAQPNLPTVFIFNAQCFVNGPAASYLTVNIVVDGHPTNPHGAHDRAFCSAG